MELAWLIVGAACAGLVQGISGFAFSMVALSFWVWSLPPQSATVMALFGSILGQLISIWLAPPQFRWRQLLPFMLGGLAGLPLGMAVLPHLNPAWFKLVVGGLLLGLCPLLLLGGKLPAAGDHILRQPRVRWWLDVLAGLCGGVMGAIGGLSGVIPAFWCTLCGMGKERQRATMQIFNLSILCIALFGYLAQGNISADDWGRFPIVAIALILPTWYGTRLYLRMDQARFRRLILCLLTLSGLAMVLAGGQQIGFSL